MKKLLFLFLFFSTFLVAQKSTILKGTVKNNLKQPIEKVSITFGNSGTETDENGNYTIRIPIDTEITLVFSHVSYQTLIEKITANNRNGIRFSPVLTLKTEKLKEIVIKDNKKDTRHLIRSYQEEEITVTLLENLNILDYEYYFKAINLIKKAYRIVYRKGYSLEEAVKQLHTLNSQDNPSLLARHLFLWMWYASVA